MSASPPFFNDSQSNPYFFSNDFFTCVVTSPGVFSFSIYLIVHFALLLLLSIFIIYFGFQQLRQKGYNFSLISHCDSFTYHMVAMELIGLCGGVACFCGVFIKKFKIIYIGMNITSLPGYGQLFFHAVTCVERYLAVVHPITYLSLRNERGIRIRNIFTGCSWLLSFVGNVVVTVTDTIYLETCFQIFSTMTVSFCSLSVLRVLIRPGPGERGKGRDKVDQSKQRAFYTIMAILVILMLRLTFGLVSSGLELSGKLNRCLMMVSNVWISLPSGLVLPLLFLLRTGKVMCCKN